jgi:hypothetical protein
MRKMALVLFPFIFFTSLMSCIIPHTYRPAVKILPDNIKKVYVKPFDNNISSFPNLEVEVTNAVVKEILQDGRLYLVNSIEEADGTLTGVIKNYQFQPFIYCKGMVLPIEYKLQIVMEVYFIDNRKGKILWSESNMEGMYICDMQSCSEKDARDNIWEKFSKSIVRRIIKEFASVS